jgi:hypothetical protein
MAFRRQGFLGAVLSVGFDHRAKKLSFSLALPDA